VDALVLRDFANLTDSIDAYLAAQKKGR